MKERNIEIDIIKGVGIILVVLGHAKFKYSNFFYLFHMPIFFIVAGYCYNKKYSEKLKGIVTLTKKRIKSLYAPYVLYNFAFIIFNNLLIKIHFLTTNTDMLNNNEVRITYIQKNYNVIDMAKEMLKILLFSGNTAFSGPFWFFKALFFATIIFAFSQWIINRLTHKKLWQVAILFLLSAVGYAMQIFHFRTWDIGTACSVYGFFLMGYILKEKEWLGKERNLIKIIAGAIVLIVLLYGGAAVELSKNYYNNTFVLWIAALAGYIMVYGIACYINKIKILGNIFSYIGRHTISIMCLHLLAFKLVNILQVYIYHEPCDYIASYPILHSGNGWSAVYTCVGVAVPLLLSVMTEQIKKAVKAKKDMIMKRAICKN